MPDWETTKGMIEHEAKEKEETTKETRRQASHKSKISEMVWQFAGDFIRMGDSLEDKQSLLNAACTAWNMACAPPEQRKCQTARYVREYLKFNPDADEDEIDGVRHNIEKLIEKKLQMFPAVLRPIVGARVTSIGDKDRIDVASASFS